MEDPRQPADDRLRDAVVIEDDADIRDLLAAVLEQSGFTVHTAVDGVSGAEAVRRHEPDVVTVDLGLPGIDGLEVVRRIRLKSDCYIVVVSARTDEAETLMALNAGADDFLTKPFRPRELRARIAAMLRRPRAALESDSPASGSGNSTSDVAGSASSGSLAAEADEGSVLRHGDLELNPHTRSVRVGPHEVELTRTEFELLHTLLLSGRRVRTKANLVRHLRDDPNAGPEAYVSEADERAVEVHIGNLRRKIGQPDQGGARIETVRGVGYRMVAHSS